MNSSWKHEIYYVTLSTCIDKTPAVHSIDKRISTLETRVISVRTNIPGVSVIKAFTTCVRLTNIVRMS